MRRIAFVFAVISLLVFGFGLAGNAQSTNQRPAASEHLRAQTTRMGNRVMRELDRIKALAPSVDLCSERQLRASIKKSDIDTFGECMISLQNFAHFTQSELTALDKFVTKFFTCTDHTQLTQYGDPTTNTFGYVFDPGDGTATFKTSALDLTVDTSTEPFLNYDVVRPTTACIAFFSQG